LKRIKEYKELLEELTSIHQSKFVAIPINCVLCCYFCISSYIIFYEVNFQYQVALALCSSPPLLLPLPQQLSRLFIPFLFFCCIVLGYYGWHKPPHNSCLFKAFHETSDLYPMASASSVSVSTATHITNNLITPQQQNTTPTTNPDYLCWLQLDQFIFSMLLSSLYEEILTQIVTYRASHDL
jgi:hypothetical protein